MPAGRNLPLGSLVTHGGLLTGLALTAAVLLVLWLGLDALVAWVVRREGRRLMGAPVTLAAAWLRPFAAEVELRSLAAANPPGFVEGAALSLERVTVRLAPRAAWRDPLVVDEVTVEGALVRVELRGGLTNLQALRDHAVAALAPGPGSRPRRFLVGRLRFVDARSSVPAPVSGWPRLTVPIRHLELRDLGGPGGVTGAQLVDVVARLIEPGLVNALRSTDFGRLLGEGVANGAGQVSAGWRAIKGIFG